MSNQNWLPDPQQYAVVQEKFRHDQALYGHGEYAIFCLMWRIRDFEEGLVGRCSRCFMSQGKIAATYGQASQEKCPQCFGTSFEGGYKALIVRPMIFDSDDEEEDEGRRGIVVRATGTLQTTSDFEIVEDYMFRADGSRWQVEATTASQKLSTGFGHRRSTAALGVTIKAIREDESSVAYMIPPPPEMVMDVLDVTKTHHPSDFTALEVIRAPLMPGSPVREGGFAAPWLYPSPPPPDPDQDDYLDSWTDFAPFGGMPGVPTVGNGSISGKYIAIGKTVTFEAEFVIGSTTAVGPTLTFAIPLPAVRTQWVQVVIGMGPQSLPTPIVVEIDQALDRIVVQVGFALHPGNFFAVSGTYEAV